MKKNLIIFLSVPFLLILTGCPYRSHFPIDKPQYKVNPAWFGVYYGPTMAAHSFDSTLSIVVDKYSDIEYDVQFYFKHWEEVDDKTERDKIAKEGDPIEQYIVHTSVIDGVTFINALRSDEYFLMKVDMVDNNMILYELTPLLETRAKNEMELKEIIKRNIGCDLLYGDQYGYKKMK